MIVGEFLTRLRKGVVEKAFSCTMSSSMITLESNSKPKDVATPDQRPVSLKAKRKTMSQQAKELALPIGIVITLITVFIGGAVWINNQLATTRSEQAAGIQRLSHDISDMNARITGMEASRFTASDGLGVWKEIASIKERIAAGDPPKWLKDQLDQINARLIRMEDKIK